MPRNLTRMGFYSISLGQVLFRGHITIILGIFDYVQSRIELKAAVIDKYHAFGVMDDIMLDGPA